MRTYRYVGPGRIAARVRSDQRGTPVRSAADVLQWVAATRQVADAEGCVIATFVIDEAGTLFIADRRSEHVACAGGQPVRSAGEMTFEVAAPTVRVAGVSNQSTGY